MATLQRQHFGVQYEANGLPFVRHRAGIIPDQEAKGARWPAQDGKAMYLLQDANVALTIADALGGPNTAPITTEPGAAISLLPGGGAHLVGPVRLPQSAPTATDLTGAWTVWAYLMIHSDSGPGGDVWPIFEDVNYYTAGHGFTVFAQSGGSTADGGQIGLFVRMLVDGNTDFNSQFQVPANDRWTFGKPMLLSMTHDGFGNITMQVWASNGLVSQASKTFDLSKGTGPVGAKTNVTRWGLGGGYFASPSRDVECWGVLQRQWTNDDALIAYRSSRALALQRGRAGS